MTMAPCLSGVLLFNPPFGSHSAGSQSKDCLVPNTHVIRKRGTNTRRKFNKRFHVKMSYNQNLNPFEEEEEDEGLDYARKGGYPRKSPRSEEDHRRQVMQQVHDSEQRQLESTRNAMASIAESEKMGIATAEELLRQGEQLDNIENKTGKVNQDLRTSQKHITNIKSIFGGIKNWWNGDKEKEPTKPQSGEKPSRLRDTLETQSTSEVHPSERLRTDNGRGFYEDDDLDTKFLSQGRKAGSSGTDRTQAFQPITNSDQEMAVNENLDLMSDGMSRLKGLALGLGDEIGTQNEQMDRISGNVDRANIKIGHQNRQMKHILK